MNPDPEDRFVHVIAHKYGHIQQSHSQQELNPGDPGATILRLPLIEGAADFVGELISGDVGDHAPFAWAKGHEAQIESVFVEDEEKTDTSNWLYNRVPSPGKPT
ncbi:MAG: lytic murein transglycosylase, partial [Gammaproteobacteria bacterium]